MGGGMRSLSRFTSFKLRVPQKVVEPFLERGWIFCSEHSLVRHHLGLRWQGGSRDTAFAGREACEHSLIYESGGEPAAVQTLRDGDGSLTARSVWTAVALAPLLGARRQFWRGRNSTVPQPDHPRQNYFFPTSIPANKLSSGFSGALAFGDRTWRR